MRKGKEGKEEVGSICKGNGSGGNVCQSRDPPQSSATIEDNAVEKGRTTVIRRMGNGRVVASVTSIQDVRRPSGITTYFVGPPRYPQFSS